MDCEISCEVELLCFNMDNPPDRNYTRQEDYFSKLKPKPDLILLQEAKLSAVFNEYTIASDSESSARYGIAYEKEYDGSQKCSCVLYSHDRFEFCCQHLLNNLPVASESELAIRKTGHV